MKFCPYCGAELLDGALFCPECGKVIPVKPQSKTVTENTDARGAYKHPKSVPLNDITPPQPHWNDDGYYDDFSPHDQVQMSSKKNRSMILKIIFVIAGVVAVVAIGISVMCLL